MTVKSWSATGKNSNLLDSVGLMVYENADSLLFVDHYTGEKCANQGSCPLCASSQVGSPCSNVPRTHVIGGLGGDATQNSINKLCSSGVGGYMVWYGSADNGFKYNSDADARGKGVSWVCGAHSAHEHHRPHSTHHQNVE